MRVNLEGRKFMIVKINILGLMSPKRRLVILMLCEIKTAHILYNEAKLPYLNIYRMIILPVDDFIFLLVWPWMRMSVPSKHPMTPGIALMAYNICFWRFASACVGILIQSRTRSISASVTLVMVRHDVD